MARQLYRLAQTNLLDAVQHSRNGRRLLAIPELGEDVAFCCQRDTLAFTAIRQSDGAIRRPDPFSANS